MAKARGLGGKGLAVLLNTEEMGENQAAQIRWVETHLLVPGRFQPRTHWNEQALEELAQSIRQQGILQPLVVRLLGDGYEIIAGERRWRAAKLANLRTLPVIVRELDDESALAVALIENIQRQNLNVLEEARALERLIHEFSLQHEEAAQLLGRSRSQISNLLRLLKLDTYVQELLETQQLDMGHARALLSLDGLQQIQMAQQIIAEGWTVRDVEAKVKSLLNPEVKPPKIVAQNHQAWWDLAVKMSNELGQKVQIKPGRKAGSAKVILDCKDLQAIEDLLQRLGISRD